MKKKLGKLLVKKNVKANIDYHTALAKVYDKSQPHFRDENKKRVTALLKSYQKRTHGNRLLDLGCGTGFILKLAEPYFKELYGVDITPAMLEIAKSKFKHNDSVQLIETGTDQIPLPNASVDVITGYSFLHHLANITPTLKEAYRVLRKGGIVYTDLDPNYYFWESIKKISHTKHVSPLLRRDIKSICGMVEGVKELSAHLNAQTIKNAEIIESYEGGFKEEYIRKIFRAIGFKKIVIEYHWFWQEGKVMHEQSPQIASYFENHLLLGLPATRSLFKYFRIEAIK